MIYIGLAGWGDHDSLYKNGIAPRNKLKEYAGHYPIVEVDASFYAIQPERNAVKWAEETPDLFQFIVKAYQGMTGHERDTNHFSTKEEMFRAFKQSLLPYQKSNKLAMVLFQFPPWYNCTKENVAYLRFCKKMMEDIPVALEFRHQSWFSPKYIEGTLDFMKEEGWIHSICDEPQAGEGAVPTVLKATHTEKTLIRFHGRNILGWKKPQQGNWRDVRYLYRYNKKELLDWKAKINQLANDSSDIFIIFNNNSGGDASDNAKQLLEFLEIEYKGLAPRQLDLF